MIYRDWIKEEKENFEKEKTKLFIEEAKEEKGLCTFSGQCDDHNCKGCPFHKD